MVGKMGIELNIIYTVWLREIVEHVRDKEKLISSLAMPLFWFIIFGTGLASSIQFKGLNMSFSDFLAPGIVAMPLLYTSILSGISVMWDREHGFLKEMLVAPVSRLSIVLGKAFGGATIATLQAISILILFILLGIKLTFFFILLIPVMLLMSLGFVGLSIIFASLLKTMEGFNLLLNLGLAPIFFLSGAFFPISILPTWLGILSRLDPMTYGVELLRYISTGASHIPFYISLPVVLIFSFTTIIIGSYLFTKKQ
jgi:ABC-2 type transport system permease protein